MPIGKDSITKRVAKSEAPTSSETKKTAAKKSATAKKAPTAAKKPASKPQEEKNIAPELVATVAAAPAPKKPAAKAPAKTAKKVDSAVLSNVAPETVEAVIGHKEDEKYEKVQIGHKMPDFLL